MSEPTPMEVSIISSGPPLWRIQLIRILQIVGILAAFIGSADFLQLLVVVPPETAKWLAISGPAFAAGIKPLVLLIGDILDDGQRNGSFHVNLLLGFLGLLGILTLSGCVPMDSWSVGLIHDQTTIQATFHPSSK